ncbi:MAG: methyl-accepting chemotaxis protein [Smithellaceae bacterium]|nr:methyl-accepting chemotaxis protein [Smithellaceae bacterium]
MNWFNDLKVRTKLLVVFGAILALSIISSGTAYYDLKGLNHAIHQIVEDRYVKIDKMDEWKAEVLMISELLRSMLLVEDPRQQDAYMGKVRELQASVADKIKYFDANIRSQEGQKLLSELKAVREEYIRERETQYNLLKEGKKKESRELLLGSLTTKEKGYLDRIEENIKFQQRRMYEAVKEADADFRRAIFVLAGAAILSFILIIFYVSTLTRTISTPLIKCASMAERLSAGDLTHDSAFDTRTVSRDETGRLVSAMKEMQDKWKEMVRELKSTSDTLASASQELSASSEQMSRGVSEQSGRASQIAASSTEMSQTVIDIAKNASNIATSATETSKTAKSGEEIVNKSVEEVKAIAQTVSESAGLMASLGERSKQIGDIVRVIKDIADQTNLLALNAAIEAARAGEQGRGFAVVADEVRKLAERTTKATSEIGGMIGAIQDEVQQAVVSMNEGTKRVEIGVQYSASAGSALHDIVVSVDNLQSMVQQIATATEQMSSVSEQISGDIDTIASVSKETSSGSDQIAESSSDLARLATILSGLVTRFKV